jgi:hypothetical protein
VVNVDFDARDLKRAINEARTRGDREWLLELLPKHVPNADLLKFLTELLTYGPGGLKLKAQPKVGYLTRRKREQPFLAVLEHIHKGMRRFTRSKRAYNKEERLKLFEEACKKEGVDENKMRAFMRHNKYQLDYEPQ